MHIINNLKITKKMEALEFENFVERVLSESLLGVHSTMAVKYNRLCELALLPHG